MHWIEIEGPLGPWPPDGYRRLFDGVPLKPQSVAKAEAEGRPVPPQPAKRPDGWWQYDPLVPAPAKPREDAERLLRSFLPRAFRRPVAEELQQYYIKLVHAALDKGALVHRGDGHGLQGRPLLAPFPVPHRADR